MIRRSRALVAASILTAVIMSFPTATINAAVQHDLKRPSTRLCPIDWRQSTWHVKKLIRCAADHYNIAEWRALHIAWRESRYQPDAYNPEGRAAGIYQHLLKYWPDRAQEYGFPDSSAFNARANVFVTMRMVREYGWSPWAL